MGDPAPPPADYDDTARLLALLQRLALDPARRDGLLTALGVTPSLTGAPAFYLFDPVEQPAATTRTDLTYKAAFGKRKPLPWPEWDGKPESFYFYLDRLISKFRIDEKWGLNGCRDLAWNSLLYTLPEP
ncbi:hypothetical protein OCS_03342 [Ophiocordyceps sinensis CO18]|uniref:Uncharacterized protein n=1 Tax=Ophiocordyceps sinensis (strain Co18 / CGMCC 3.14243) TaxID=911162 RepID=T5AGK0_OPHSC|nr:hypothetical protein OCS_03342 [Ophiocordyceps sinensis CO18]